MSRLPTGGAGSKRRIRTMLRAHGNVIEVMPNRSIKRLPANWRELLDEFVGMTCRTPPGNFSAAGVTRQPIPKPVSVIPLGSLPTAPILFVLDGRHSLHGVQRRAIDWALTQCDVHTWPVPKTIVRKNKSEVYVATDLHLVDTFTGISFSTFRPHRLQNVAPLIDWRHIRPYTARRGKAELMGARTICDTSPCECRRRLPDIWQFGWELQY